MVYVNDDTICAVASAAGIAARGIVRLSGPNALRCLSAVCEPFEMPTSAKVISVEMTLEVGQLSACVPADAYVWPSTRSYTKQPSVEIHMTGARPLLDAVLGQLCRHGARVAQPGEFTMRAFLAGRLDLPQAEAVLGVIDADNNQQLKSALSQLAGGLSGLLNELRNELIHLLAHLEAGLDFVEEDIEFISAEDLQIRLETILGQLTHTLQQMESRSSSTDAYQIVFSGLPNAGKSSLMNALAGENIAIVSDEAGTTRDYVKREIQIAGFPCEFVDTAGSESVRLDSPDAAIQANAQFHTQSQTSEAHIVLNCIDLCGDDNVVEALEQNDSRRIVVGTKSDLATGISNGDHNKHSCDVITSSKSGVGLDELKSLIANRLEERLFHGEFLFSTSSRCRDCLTQAVSSIEQALGAARARLGEELVAADLRLALDQLGQIIGVVYTDDILDQIFGQFCIGK